MLNLHDPQRTWRQMEDTDRSNIQVLRKNGLDDKAYLRSSLLWCGWLLSSIEPRKLFLLWAQEVDPLPNERIENPGRRPSLEEKNYLVWNKVAESKWVKSQFLHPLLEKCPKKFQRHVWTLSPDCTQKISFVADLPKSQVERKGRTRPNPGSTYSWLKPEVDPLRRTQTNHCQGTAASRNSRISADPAISRNEHLTK